MPRNVAVMVLSETSVKLMWMPPRDNPINIGCYIVERKIAGIEGMLTLIEYYQTDILFTFLQLAVFWNHFRLGGCNITLD